MGKIQDFIEGHPIICGGVALLAIGACVKAGHDRKKEDQARKRRQYDMEAAYLDEMTGENFDIWFGEHPGLPKPAQSFRSLVEKDPWIKETLAFDENDEF